MLILAGGGASQPVGSAERVRQLVRQLEAPQRAQRESAEQELLKLGPSVLNLLPAPAEPTTGESAQRLERIRRKLQQVRAESHLEASRVELGGTLSVSAMLEAIQQQTGNRISTERLDPKSPALARSFDANYRGAPFWPTLDDLLDRAGLAMYPFGEHGRIELVVRPETQVAERGDRVSYSGPFRFEAVALLAQRDLRDRGGSGLKLELELAWEPRLAPIHFAVPLAEVEAVDDLGRPVAVESRQATLEIPVGQGPIAKRLTLPLALPARDARTLARLHGSCHALVPGPLHTFRFGPLGKIPGEQRVAAVSVRLEEVAQSAERVLVRIGVRYDRAEGALASHRTWIFNNPARLEGPNNQAVSPESGTPTRQTATEFGIAYEFRLAGPLDSYTFVYQTPTAIFLQRLEYQFRDLPLP